MRFFKTHGKIGLNAGEYRSGLVFQVGFSMEYPGMKLGVVGSGVRIEGWGVKRAQDEDGERF